MENVVSAGDCAKRLRDMAARLRTTRRGKRLSCTGQRRRRRKGS